MVKQLGVIVALVACSSPPKQVVPRYEVVPVEPAPPDRVPAGQVPPRPAAEPAPYTDQQFLADCRGYLTASKAQRDAIVDVPARAQVKRTVENTLEPYNEAFRLMRNASSMASLFAEVHPDPKVRDAARACELEASAYNTELSLDRRLYDAIQSVDVSAADAATKRFVAHTLRDYQRSGATLDDKKRARIKGIQDAIATVSQDIGRTIAEDTRSIEVTDPKRLGGLPADYIAAHAPDANGVIRITTDYPDYIPFVSYADDDELKKQLYIKFRSRGDRTNEASIRKLLVLRAELAKLLGFANWADYQSDDKMLRGGKAAQQFIDRIVALASARAKTDYAELLAQLRKRDPKAKAVTEWQKAWLETAVKKEKYAVDAAAVREYFEFDKTLAGLLDITSTIYDVQYKPATDRRTWHPDVRVYDVVRKDVTLGRIFLDLHPRPDKYKHAAEFTLRDGVIGKQLPEGALVCNFPSPKSGSPALMEHGDVVTMFHEFGHLMHHVLGGHQKWVAQSGIATEHDFVEAPSQMFEEWGWSYETLSRFARHYKTGETIPRDLVAKMQKSRKFGIGLYALQQMLYASLSLQLHQAPDPDKLDQLALLKKVQLKTVPFAYVEGTRFHTSFGHLVGYSSMYYTYMWSLVIARDMLTPFEQSGLMDTAVTHRYRDTVLAPGGTKDAADLVADFLGRKYDFKAYERYLAD